MTDVVSIERFGLGDRLSVLRNRSFRRLLAGRAVSVLGDGLYTVAAMWLVYELTGSTAYTGIAGFLTGIPGLLSVLVGPIVDRSELERVLTLSEVGQGLVVLVVPLAWATGHLTAGVVLATMPLLSLVGLFANPAQNAAVPRLVPSDALVRANAATTTVRKTVDATARGAGGLLIAAVGAVGVYLVDAATFGLAALVFLGLSVPSAEPHDDEDAASDDAEAAGDGATDADAEGDGFDLDTYRDDLREGVATIAGSELGLMVVGSLSANFLFGVAYAVLPAFADGIGDAGTYGLLLAGLTAGTVVGSLLASVTESYPLGWTTIVSLTGSGLLFAFAVWLAAPLLTVGLVAVSRVPIGIYNVSVMATLQSGVPQDRLGRVSAVLGSAASLVSPAGILLGGLLGTVVGAPAVMLASAAGTVLTALFWLATPSLRRFGPPVEVEQGRFA
ncbi:MFS transporter [Haloarchaeobius iranensis]|uniref:MFS transporter n=1 Tax=Haloarchaeobius iranensis TaxID=996166 RepID=UPI0015870B1D|nr:MFS transporter [Haloarchaeobius iranensis]